MAAYVASGITLDTASGTKTVVLTPAVGEHLVVFVANTGQTAQPTLTDNNPDGRGTYTVGGTGALKAASADRMFVFVRNALVGSASSTTVTMTPGATTGGGLAVVRVSGMSIVGGAAIRATGKQENQAGGGTPAPAFPQAALTANLCLGALFNAANPATVTPPASWTERHDVGYATPTTGLEIATRDSGETGTTVTWGSTSASEFASLVVELDTSVPFVRRLLVPRPAVSRASVW